MAKAVHLAWYLLPSLLLLQALTSISRNQTGPNVRLLSHLVQRKTIRSRPPSMTLRLKLVSIATNVSTMSEQPLFSERRR